MPRATKGLNFVVRPMHSFEHVKAEMEQLVARLDKQNRDVMADIAALEARVTAAEARLTALESA